MKILTSSVKQNVFLENVLAFLGTISLIPVIYLVHSTLILADICIAFLVYTLSIFKTSLGVEDQDHRSTDKKVKGVIPIDVFDIDSPEWSWDYLRENYIRKATPFILQPSKTSGPIARYDFPGFDKATGRWNDGQSASANMEIRSLPLLAKICGLHKGIADKLIPFHVSVHPTLIITGNHQGTCHLDAVPNGTNFYWMMQGSKDVVIIPPQITRNVYVSPGKANLTVPGSLNSYDYLRTIEAYYRFSLKEGQILVFNQSVCLHHFAPGAQEPEKKEEQTKTKLNIGVSVRSVDYYYSRGADARIWLSHFFNPLLWWAEARGGSRMLFLRMPMSQPAETY